MKYLFFIVIGYIVLYLTVWLHEVGHSIWDCLFGVKQGWLKVNVKPYIFFSTPGELDVCIQKAVQYMSDCLVGKKTISDRGEKCHDWNVFLSLILATGIRRCGIT